MQYNFFVHRVSFKIMANKRQRKEFVKGGVGEFLISLGKINASWCSFFDNMACTLPLWFIR